MLPVKNENDNVQRFLFNGIGPPVSVPAVKPTPIAVVKILQVKRRTRRSASVWYITKVNEILIETTEYKFRQFKPRIRPAWTPK